MHICNKFALDTHQIAVLHSAQERYAAGVDMAEEWKFHYERFGFKFTVWANRIEVQQRGMLAWKSDTLLIRNITDVGVRLGGKLRITLSDGGIREYVLGSKAEEARGAILALI